IPAATEQKILTIKCPSERAEVSPHAFVPAVGSRRRLRALLGMGYTQQYMADHIGSTRAGISYIIASQTNDARAKSAGAIAAMFDELQMVHPPDSPYAKRARTLARQRGWPPPLAWDEDTIDSPSAQPAGRASAQSDRLSLYLKWRAEGLTDAKIASRLGISASSLSRWRLRQEGLGLIA